MMPPRPRLITELVSASMVEAEEPPVAPTRMSRGGTSTSIGKPLHCFEPAA